MLISPSVVEIERLLHACENELDWLDLAINFKKNLVMCVSALVMMLLVCLLLV